MGGEISNAIIALEKTKLKAIDSLQIVSQLAILPDLQMVLHRETGICFIANDSYFVS